MITAEQLYNILSDLIPSSLSCDWDNDGLMVLPSPGLEVRKVLVALDADEYVCSYAVKNGFDAIVTHHPLVFRPLKNVTNEKLASLIKNDVAVLSFHTRLDAYSEGVNRVLAEKLQLRDISFLENGLGTIGNNPVGATVSEYAEYLGNLLETAVSFIPSEMAVKRVAVIGGSGGDYANIARDAGADVLVTGEAGYHDICDAADNGIYILACGHYETEYPVCSLLKKMILQADSDLYVELLPNKRIAVVKQ